MPESNTIFIKVERFVRSALKRIRQMDSDTLWTILIGSVIVIALGLRYLPSVDICILSCAKNRSVCEAAHKSYDDAVKAAEDSWKSEVALVFDTEERWKVFVDSEITRCKEDPDLYFGDARHLWSEWNKGLCNDSLIGRLDSAQLDLKPHVFDRGTYNLQMRLAARVVTNNPDCFSVTEVAKAQEDLDTIPQ